MDSSKTGLEYSIEDNGYGNLFNAIRKNSASTLKAVQKAKEEARAQDLIIIDPTLNDDEVIDKEWDRYNSCTKPFRRKADWITLNYFGLINQQIYDYLKHMMYERMYTVSAGVSDGNCGTSEDPINISEGFSSDIQYVPDSQQVEDIDQAICSIEDVDRKMEIGDQYMKDTGYILLIPANIPNLDILEKYWDSYKTMVIRHQRMADWKTVELFGLTNEQIYIGLKKKFLMAGQDFINDDNDPNVKLYVSENKLIESYFDTVITKDDVTNKELATGLMNCARRPDFCDKISSRRIITNQIDKFGDLTVNVPSTNWDYTDLPAYTPDELIDDGVYSGGIDPEGPIPNDDMITGKIIMAEDWFREYCAFFNLGVQSEEYRKMNMHRIHELERLYNVAPHDRDQAWNESVRKWGWNPKSPFNEYTRSVVDVLMRSTLREHTNHYDFVDVSDAVANGTLTESDGIVKDGGHKPIYIVLFSGKNLFSKAIKRVTKSEYSHAMLSLDSSFKRCYSYGMEGATSSLGGFIIEDLTKKPKDAMCKIYATIISSDAYDTIKKNCEWFVQMQKKTRYAFEGIVSYLFRIPIQQDTNMICSQFVDRMIKLGHIDFTKKASSLLSPADIDRAARKNRKIYTIYKGLAHKVNQFVIDRKVDDIFTKGKFLESFDMCSYRSFIVTDEMGKLIYNKLLAPIDEIKELPIRINKNGDVLVSSFKKVDYEAEFAKSHKLLMEYDRENNIEGMKAELAKLWSYLLQIEEKLYGMKSVSPSQRSALFKARAKIIGDFKKYMNVVLRNEEGFDFGQYYEQSPYSNETYRVSGSTIHGLLKAVKTIIY